MNTFSPADKLLVDNNYTMNIIVIWIKFPLVVFNFSNELWNMNC